MTETIFSEEDIETIAKELLNKYGDFKVWVFHGEMGAGKTTLIKSICKVLEVKDAMSSPTFSIVNVYEGAENELYHFDFYRLEDPKDAINIGIEDYFFSGNWCFIEWPDKIEEFLPDKYLEISIKLVDSNTRQLTVNFNGPTV